MVHSGRQRLCFKWWRIRPASHMPDAERMTLGFGSSLIARDSSTLTDNRSPGKRIGLIPWRTSAMASSSKHSCVFVIKIFVASTASGLSTKTSVCSNSGSSWSTLSCLKKYNISCVRPTAKQGITKFPPAASVSFKICFNSLLQSKREMPWSWLLFPYVDSITT